MNRIKHFLLNCNRPSLGLLDITYCVGAASALHFWFGDRGPWVLLAGSFAAGAILAFLHALWGVVFGKFYDDFSAPCLTPEDDDLGFLADEGFSLLKVGQVWGVLDAERVLIGKFQDTPHAAVSSARVEVANGR